MKNLFLIGMMGSWKSTVGRKLAETMNMDFIDTDEAIEEVTEMKIFNIFNEFGEDKFRDMEAAFFGEKAKQTGHVFSTGGGIVLKAENRKIIKTRGITFFLHASIEILAKRINNTTKRPLLTGTDNLEGRLQEIWKNRNKYYKDCAHHIINTDDMTPLQVMDEILTLLEVPFAHH